MLAAGTPQDSRPPWQRRSNFISNVFNFFVLIEHRWAELLRDIELGTISDALPIEDSVRVKLAALLSPDPERAAELRASVESSAEGSAESGRWGHSSHL